MRWCPLGRPTAAMAEPRDQLRVGQEPQRTLLGDVDHHRIVGLTIAQERDDAVVTRTDRRADAVGAVDHQRFTGTGEVGHGVHATEGV